MQLPATPYLGARLQEIDAKNKVEEKKHRQQIKVIKAALSKRKRKT